MPINMRQCLSGIKSSLSEKILQQLENEKVHTIMNTVSFIHTHTVLKPGVKIFNYFLPMQWMTVGSNSKTGLH